MTGIPVKRKNGSICAYTQVDPADAEWLRQWTWRLDSDGYVRRYERRQGKFMAVSMARTILGLEHGDPREADHKNRDKLDNRRANLRIVTGAQNKQNFPAYRTAPWGERTSTHRGVGWHKHRRKWRARATMNGKVYNLGYYDQETDAVEAVITFRNQHMPYSTD